MCMGIIPHGPPDGSNSKESACNAGDLDSIGKIPWRREWLHTPVLLPGESYGQRSLAGYNPWSPKELDMTESLILSLSSLVIWEAHGVDASFCS